MKREPKKILIVDDDLVMLRILEKRLLNDGYNAISASDGTSGLNKAQSEIPDLILLDLHSLNKMNERELVNH